VNFTKTLNSIAKIYGSKTLQSAVSTQAVNVSSATVIALTTAAPTLSPTVAAGNSPVLGTWAMAILIVLGSLVVILLVSDSRN
jgi:hypothetical protein